MARTQRFDSASDFINQLAPAAAEAWDIGWKRLFHPRTNLFYDYVTSYDPDHRFDHLPTLEEIARQYPNPNGWTSGMEDSVINGGVMLATACDRYVATGDEAMRDAAATIFKGLVLCGTHSSEPGMVIRSVSPFDGESYFIETSRDQLTHFAHGLWRFYRSPLASDEQKQRCRSMMTALCKRLEARVVAANDYHFGREDGTPGLVDQMWEVSPHEAPRLPMIYAVAWEMTGDAHWHAMYERYVEDALDQAARLNIAAFDFCYALFQHQVSMETLAAVADQDASLRDSWREQMGIIADYMPPYHEKFQDYQRVDVGTINMNIRTRPNRERFVGSDFGHVAVWPEEMSCEFRPLRELGESLLVRLMAPQADLDDHQRDLLARSLTDVDYGKTFTYAMLYPQAAYWRYAANLKGLQP